MDGFRKCDSSHETERGAVLILVAVALIALCALVALAVDVGWMYLTRTELQGAADASALAAAAQLVDEDAVLGSPDLSDDIGAARDSAVQFALLNKAAQSFLSVDRNDANSLDGGVVAGYLSDPSNLDQALDTTNPQQANSVSVTCERTATQNGTVPLFFAAVGGHSEASIEARATATLDDRVAGFGVREGQNLPMLPFAADEVGWYAAMSGGVDDYSVHDGVVLSGCADGIPELTLYPYRWDASVEGVRGNVRTVFVSAEINTTYVKYQIRDGMNQADLDFVNGLELTDDGGGDLTQWLPAENWMSSTWHTMLNTVKGQIRILPLYRSINESPPLALFQPFGDVLPERPADLLGLLPETCCGIYEYVEVTEFKAVTVLKSRWPSSSANKCFYVQPAQMVTDLATINPNIVRAARKLTHPPVRK